MIGRLAVITALLGALIVILSQLVTAFSLVNEFDEVLDTVTLLSKHGVTTLILGLAAAGATIYAVVAGSRSATIVVIGMGAAVILTFLLVDLPDIGEIGMFNAPSAGNVDATGQAEPGLWLELLGGVILVLSGLALRTLSDDQLRSIRPDTQSTGPRSKRKSDDSEEETPG